MIILVATKFFRRCLKRHNNCFNLLKNASFDMLINFVNRDNLVKNIVLILCYNLMKFDRLNIFVNSFDLMKKNSFDLMCFEGPLGPLRELGSLFTL